MRNTTFSSRQGIALLFYLCISFSIPAQNCWEWAIDASSSGFDRVHDIAVDSINRRIYIVGMFANDLSADLGPDLAVPYGQIDGFVAKFDFESNLIWAFKLGGTLDDEATGVSVGDSGTIYISGFFSGTAEFRGTAGSPTSSINSILGSRDIFVAKYGSSGHLMWVNTQGDDQLDGANEIAYTSSAIYISGYYSGTVNFNGNSRTSTGGQDFFVSSHNPINGTLSWVVVGGSSQQDYGVGITADNSGVFVTGEYVGTPIAFEDMSNPGLFPLTNANSGTPDIFLAGVDLAGDLQFADKISSNLQDISGGIATTTGDAFFYVTGSTSPNPTFPGLGLVGGQNQRDIFVSKHSKTNGSASWAKVENTTSAADGAGLGIDADNYGNIYVTGYFDATTDFSGTMLTTTGARDVFLAKYDASGVGSLDYVIQGGGASFPDQGFEVAAYKNQSAYVAGEFLQEAIFGNDTVSGPLAQDIFLAKTGNELPEANADTVCTNESVAVRVDVQSNDLEPNGDVMTTTVITGPTGGSFTILNSDSISFTPNGGFSGLDSLEYKVCDPAAGCDSAWAYFYVLPQATTGTDTSLCDASAYTMQANTALPFNGNWTLISGPGTIATPGDPNATLTVTGFGSIMLEWKIDHYLGCISQDTVSITNHDLPTAQIGNNDTICEGDSTQIVFSLSGVSPWNIYYNDGTSAFSEIGIASATHSMWVSPSLTTTYSLDSVSDQNGCVQYNFSGPKTTVVNALPIVNLGPDTVVCDISPSLVLNAGNPGASYAWLHGPSTQTVNVNSTSLYFVTVNDTNSCSAVDSINVSIVNMPIVNLGPDTTLCGGDSLLLDAGNSGASFSWSTSSSNQSIWATVNDTFSVIVDAGFSCTASDSIIVNFPPIPALYLGADTSICGGDSLMLDAQNPGATFLWSTGNTSATITTDSTGLYWVSVTDPVGCMAMDTLILQVIDTLNVNLGPDTFACGSFVLDAGIAGATSYLWNTGATTQTIPIFTSGDYGVSVSACGTADDSVFVSIFNEPKPDIGSDTTICETDSLQLFADQTSVFPGATYLWSTLETGSTIYVSNPGTYILNLQDSNGCVGADTLTLGQYAVNTMNLGPDTSICAGDSLPLSPVNAWTTYQWSTGSTTDTLWVDSSGIYTLTVTDANACQRVDDVAITANPLPIINLGPDSSYCLDSISLDAGNGTTFLWSSGQNTQSVQVFTSGMFWVEVQDINNCIARDSIDIQLFPALNINLGPDLSSCDSVNILLDAGNPGAAYLWSGGTSNQTLPVTVSGVYWVQVTDSNTCQATDSILIELWATPVLALGKDSSICDGDSLMLDAGNPGMNFLWSTGHNGQQLWIQTGGMVQVTVSSGPGCEQSDSVLITLNPTPLIELGADTSFCEGDSILLNPGGNYTYQWSTGENSRELWINSSGNYSVIATDMLGCEKSDTIDVVTDAIPTIANAGLDQILFGITQTQLNANVPSIGFGNWNQVGSAMFFSDPTDPQSQVSGLSIGENELIWTISNGTCPSTTDTLRIIVNDLKIPEAISPNEDGLNDFFVIEGLEKFAIKKLNVFNRWGSSVFQINTYDNTWGGKNESGQLLSDDTYYYLLDLGVHGVYKGYVVIKR